MATSELSEATRVRGPGRALAFFAIAVVIGHHIGTAAAPLGEVGSTRWADWIDLLVPVSVLGAAAFVLRASKTAPQTWVVYAVGALLYAEGHGIHLAANSIGNELDYGSTGHLWDEVIGHYVWYAGLAVVVVAMALALCGAALRSWTRWPLAAVVGVTWTTNGIEGGTPWFSLGIAVALAVWGLRRRDDAGRMLMAAFGLSALLFASFGIWQGGFPEFTELGWV